MFEHHHESLVPKTVFFWRVVRYASLSVGTISVSLLIGILGYHYFEACRGSTRCILSSRR